MLLKQTSITFFHCAYTVLFLKLSLSTHSASHGSKERVLHLHGLQGDNEGPLGHGVSLLALDLLHHPRHRGSQNVGLVFLSV